ncbi:MAG: nucleotidyltransferase domain-containing protein [Nitrospirae bacterium]|nr:nucleotidyltransferase domain-containing protein [Nitrospirota bacterium]
MRVDERIRHAVEDLAATGAEKIILFGSAARGETDDESDLDFVVIRRTHERFVERLEGAARALRTAEPIDVFVYTPEEFERMAREENPFILNVLSDGRVVFEKPA